MVYRKKITVLAGIIAVLAVVYILTFIFDPQRMGSRSDAYTWLDPQQKDRIGRIVIANAEQTINLVRSDGQWFVSHNGKNYPARQMRVDDFINVLTRRAPYPLRSSNASSHERLSLTEETSMKVSVTGVAGQPMLNLLVGQGDMTGQNVYLRKQGQNEVRSGEDRFSAYTGSELTSWFNLRLFPESESGSLDAASVQGLTVYPPADGGETRPYSFTRRNRQWAISGMEIADPDMGRIDGYVRDILNTAGDNFDDTVSPSDPMFNSSQIVLELGDGSTRTIRLAPPQEDGRQLATVTGSDLVYSLSPWTSGQLFAESYYFEKD